MDLTPNRQGILHGLMGIRKVIVLIMLIYTVSIKISQDFFSITLKVSNRIPPNLAYTKTNA